MEEVKNSLVGKKLIIYESGDSQEHKLCFHFIDCKLYENIKINELVRELRIYNSNLEYIEFNINKNGINKIEIILYPDNASILPMLGNVSLFDNELIEGQKLIYDLLVDQFTDDIFKEIVYIGPIENEITSQFFSDIIIKYPYLYERLKEKFPDYFGAEERGFF